MTKSKKVLETLFRQHYRQMYRLATLLRNYINGFKKPSAERESAILAHIHKLGKEMMAACF